MKTNKNVFENDPSVIKPIDMGSKEWKEFVSAQKARIIERLARYNNIDTIKEQLSETGNLSGYQNYKIEVVSNFLLEAIEAIDKGTYGICKKCNQVIPFERLVIVPGALKCVACD